MSTLSQPKENEYCYLPCAAAAMGIGTAVENIKARPLDCMNFFQLLLLKCQ